MQPALILSRISILRCTSESSDCRFHHPSRGREWEENARRPTDGLPQREGAERRKPVPVARGSGQGKALGENRKRKFRMATRDRFGGQITDLRASVTDRGNFRCVYCRSAIPVRHLA